MAKFYEKVGYATTSIKTPGVWTEDITERSYYGEVIRNSRRWQSGENLNDDLNINNLLSIVADAFAYENFQAIKYIDWMGSSWKVTNIDVQRPRLILTIGGVYNKDE